MSDYFFEEYGDIGFQFNNIKELNQGLQKINEEHDFTYIKKTKNLKKIVKHFNPRLVQNQLKEIILK